MAEFRCEKCKGLFDPDSRSVALRHEYGFCLRLPSRRQSPESTARRREGALRGWKKRKAES
jgi:hypothetical protein